MTDASSDAPRYATLSDYLRVVRDNWWLIGLLTVLFAAAALAWSLRQDEVYVAEAALSFQDPGRDLDILGTPTAPSKAPEQRAAEAATQVTEPSVMEEVKRELGTGLSVAELRGMVTASPEARTNFVIVQVRHDDPRFAARVADAVATTVRAQTTARERARFDRAARTQRRRLRSLDPRRDAVTRSVVADRVSRLETLRDIARPVEVVRRASVPAVPVEPRPVRSGLLGGIVGLTLALIAAFTRDALDRRLRRASQVQEEFGLPILGQLNGDALGRTIASTNGRKALEHRDLEAARMVRTGLRFMSPDQQAFRSVAVTSAVAEEGKTTVAASLAYTASLSGKRVVLVECDLRRPVLAKRLGIADDPGVGDVVLSASSTPEVVQEVPVPAAAGVPTNGGAPSLPGPAAGGVLHCIVAGTVTPQPAELLGSNRFGEFVQELGELYDLVVLDTAPMLAVVDTLHVLPHVDRVVLCARRGKTTREQAAAVRSTLRRLPERPAGLVITGVTARDEDYYGAYGYGY